MDLAWNLYFQYFLWLVGFLADVLNFHRVNDGKVTLALHPFCPSVFLTNLAHSLSIVLSSKRIVFLTHIDPRLAAFFCSGDKHRIQQVRFDLLKLNYWLIYIFV